MSEGYNTFRVPFKMERLALGGVGGSFSPDYLANFSTVINHITQKGGWAILDPHNYGRYNDAIITDTNAFKSFWSTLATVFKGNSKVVSSPVLIIGQKLTYFRSLTQTMSTMRWIRLLS